MRNFSFFIGLAAAIGGPAMLAGCEEKPPDITISQFDRPQDVALVCYDDKRVTPLPLGCCRKRATLEDRDCDTDFASAKLYAFVTQTTPGEVAVVDVEEQEIIDQDERIPYNSFIPVGGQPNDIAATEDGQRVYTANYETGDVSIIRVVNEDGFSVINQPYLSPADSIDLGGPAAKMFLVKAPVAYKDQFLFVTQPTLGRLSVLALRGEDCPDPESQPDGCLIGYLPLNEDVPDPNAEEEEDVPDPDTEEEEEGEEEEVEAREIHPWAITGSEGQSVYVGSYDGSVIWDIQTESLIAQALALETPGPVDPEAVLNDAIPIAPNTTRALSVEPRRMRWLYAVENQDSKVIAINLEARRENPEKPPEIVDVLNLPGKARTLALVELEEEDEVDPLTFNGTFGIVSTSNSGIAVIDVEDRNSTVYPHPHYVRSTVNLMSDAGVPKMDDRGISLTIDNTVVKENQVDDYIYFAEDGGDAEDGGESCEADTDFRPEYENGVKFRCDPYLSTRDTWTVTYGGSLGVTGLGKITNIQDNGGRPWRLLHTDEKHDFCAEEIYARGTTPGYLGDVVKITSDPTPREGFEDLCEEKYDKDHELLFRVVGVDESNAVPNILEIERDVTLLKEPDKTPDLIPKCYGQDLTFEIFAGNHWIINGRSSEGTPAAGTWENGRCSYEGSRSELRVIPNTRFENEYLTFRLKYGDEWAETGPVSIEIDEDEHQVQVTSAFSFTIIDGYEQMYQAALGNNITDIEFTPDNEMLLVDQGGQGLIMFDLIDDFETIGTAVN